MRPFRLSTIVAVFACLPAAASTPLVEPPFCANETAAVASKTAGVPAALRTRVDRAVGRASALVRFHRGDEGRAKLDAIVTLLDGPRGERLQDSKRTELTKSIQALKNCLASIDPAPLATITVRTFGEGGPEGTPGAPTGEGVYVDVEGIRVGRTGPDGTLQASVPSGTIEIRATEYPSSAGAEEATVAPGGSATISIVLADSKEPGEDSDMVIHEAPDDILPATSTSLTLSFEQDEQPVTIESVDAIGVSDTAGTAREDLTELFRIARGAMHATDATAVYGRIRRISKIGRPLTLDVFAVDTEGRSHYGSLTFYVGQFRLAVTLAAPPSNPALPVSNIAVRVSVVGGDVAMRRVSDAYGRFDIEALPDATIAFDAHTVASNIHYYGNATLSMCADRAVTVPMLNVKDLVAGIRQLTIDSGPSACPPVPRH